MAWLVQHHNFGINSQGLCWIFILPGFWCFTNSKLLSYCGRLYYACTMHALLFHYAFFWIAFIIQSHVCDFWMKDSLLRAWFNVGVISLTGCFKLWRVCFDNFCWLFWLWWRFYFYSLFPFLFYIFLLIFFVFKNVFSCYGLF